VGVYENVRRTYLLNHKEIDSSRVAGIIHRATKDLGPCTCGDKDCVIKVENYYAQFLGYLPPNLFNLDCLGPDRDSCIFGVSVLRRRVNRWGVVRVETVVICEELKYDHRAQSYHYPPVPGA
jgi:hypothetical protein